MAKPIDERIAAAMGTTARAATVRDLIDEITSVIAEAEVGREREHAISIDLTTGENAAEVAAANAAKLAARITRLSAKKAALVQRHEEIENSEARKRREVERQEIVAERDALADELRERWPEIESSIVDLLMRIKASDQRCARINIASAEAEARGCNPSFNSSGAWLPRLTEIQLPLFAGANGIRNLAWPLAETNPANAVFAENFAAIEAAHRRNRNA